MWGKGYPQLIHRNPNPNSKFELRLQIGIVGCGVLLPRSAEGPPYSGAAKIRPGPMQAEPVPALIQQAEGLRPVPLPSCGPFPARSWKKCRPGAVPGPRSTRPWSRFQPLSGPFPPFPAAAAGLVGVCRTCPGADPAADLPDLLPVQAAEGLPDLGRVS